MSHYRSECTDCGEYASLNDDGRCGPEVNDCAAVYDQYADSDYAYALAEGRVGL